MRIKIFTILLLIANYTFAQTNTENKTLNRKGFIFGFGIGAGALFLKTSNTFTNSFSTTLPNLKIGYRFNEKIALTTLLPGANYKYNGSDRGFEGVIIAGQFWIKKKWWVLGGMGLTFDAPAFYTVQDPTKAEFYTGLPALSIATAYEVWHKGNFSLDAQYRLFYGNSNLPNNNHRKGVSNMFILGFNWN